jgi:tetratricopeptide (TPR) repeat protein
MKIGIRIIVSLQELFIKPMHKPVMIGKMGTLLLLLIFYNLSAQKADSLRTSLKNSGQDTTRVEILIQLCTMHWNKYPDSALYYANNALSLSKEIDYPRGTGMALNYIGVVYFYQADYKHADEYLQQSIEYCKEKKLKGPLSHALSNAGMSQEWQGNYVLSMEYRLEALQYAEETKNVGRKIKLLTSIGMLYSLLNNAEMAEKYLLNSVDEANKNGIKLSPSQTAALATVYEKEKKYEESVKYNLLSLEQLKSNGNNHGVAVASHNVGNSYMLMNQIDKARPYVQEAYQLSLQLDDLNVKALVALTLSELRYRENRISESIQYAQEAMKHAVPIKALPRILESYRLLAKAYTSQGRYKEANTLWNKAYDLNDSILGTDLTNAVANAQKGYELAKKQSEIDQLNTDAKIADLQFKNERLQKNMLVIGIIMVLIVACIVWYIYSLKTKLNRELRLSAELKATRSQINPHFIFNSLTAIQETVSSGHYDNAIRYVGDFSLLLRKILDKSYLSFVTLEDEIKTMDLYLKVESIRFSDMFSWEIKVDDEIDSSEIEIPAMLMQPFLENALRHGLLPKKDQRFLAMSFLVEAGRFICRIEDNGVGRAVGLKNKSIQDNDRVSRGNQLIADRISLLNLRYNLDAQLAIDDLYDENDNASGTRVEISFDDKTLRRDA